MTNNPMPSYLSAVAFVQVGTANALNNELHMASGHPVKVVTTIPNFSADHALLMINQYQPEIVMIDADVSGFSSAAFLELRGKIDAPVALVGFARSGTTQLDEMHKGGYDAAFPLPFNSMTFQRIIEDVPKIYSGIHKGWEKGMWGLKAAGEIREASAAAGGAEWERATVALFSPKGGVGKTWLATELAAMLAGIGGRRVALVDANMNGGHIRLRLNIKVSHSILNAAHYYHTNKGHPSTAADIPQKILDLMRPSPGLGNLSVLPGIVSMEQATQKDLAGEQGAEFIAYLITLLKKHYDFVIVDVGSSTNVGVHRGVLGSVDYIYVVATSDVTSLADNKAAVSSTLYSSLGTSQDRVRLVVNKWDDRVGVSLKRAGETVGVPGIALIPLDKTNSTTLAGNDGQSYVAMFGNQKGNDSDIENVLSGLANLAGNLYGPVVDAWNARGDKSKKKKKGFGKKKGK